MWFLFAFGPYFLAEGLQLSGIMSVLFCGIVMSHYNLTPVTQVTVQQTMRTVSFLAGGWPTCIHVRVYEPLRVGRETYWGIRRGFQPATSGCQGWCTLMALLFSAKVRCAWAGNEWVVSTRFSTCIYMYTWNINLCLEYCCVTWGPCTRLILLCMLTLEAKWTLRMSRMVV